MTDKRIQVLEMLEQQEEVIKPVHDILSNPEVQEHIESGRCVGGEGVGVCGGVWVWVCVCIVWMSVWVGMDRCVCEDQNTCRYTVWTFPADKIQLSLRHSWLRTG